jgi:dimethylamine/trimethylamine dehydrogenase
MKNRFYATPHATNFGVDFPYSQAAFREMRAEGGFAVVNTEYVAVHEQSDDYPWVQARLIDDDDVRAMSLLCDRIHAHDALASIELNFLGPDHTAFGSRLPARGVSQLEGGLWAASSSCYEMSKSDIRALQQSYAETAKRALRAGFDFINVAGPETGSITQHFLSRFWNKRTDEYGGPFENRARFWRETLERVRDAIGDSAAVTARFCVDSRAVGGKDAIRVDEEGIGFIELTDHLVDLWDVQVDAFHDDAGPSRFYAQNWQRPWIEKLRPHTKKPIVGVGRFTDPDIMVEAVRSGQLDVIGMARPGIADPFLPRKVEEGRPHEIRECIGCNLCVSRVTVSARIICTQNATVGEEYRRNWHPERFEPLQNSDRSFLIVGAGPAGLECATVLARRGAQNLHLVDAAQAIGGNLRWVTQFEGLGEWNRLVQHRNQMLKRNPSAQVILNRQLSATDILSYGAETVIFATGANFSRDGLNFMTHLPIPGADADLPHVLTPEQIMAEGKEPPGKRVLIYDCDGYFVGPSLAERLSSRGFEVVLVTPRNQVASFMFTTGEGPHMLRRLLSSGVVCLTDWSVDSIEEGRVHGSNVHLEEFTRTWEIDAVVLVTQRLSNDQVYRDVIASLERERIADLAVYRIGDCLEPRIMADCVFDGQRLAREIDCANPAEPLPFMREHLRVEALNGALGVAGDGR